ncbi:MAG: hypothetical protein ABJA11_03160 [Pseudolysinimonas sp.]
MSGTDDLFPDAAQLPGAVVPATPAPPSAPTLAVAPRRRGLGTAAFTLGLLAILGDVVGILVAIVTLVGSVTNLGETVSNIDSSLGTFLGVIVLEFVLFFGGILFAAVAVILGIVAAVRKRGRVLGVFGVIFGAIVLISHVGLSVVVATSGNVPGVTS